MPHRYRNSHAIYGFTQADVTQTFPHLPPDQLKLALDSAPREGCKAELT